ncbi:hypothetical protein [Microbacterium sp. Ag1]|uniref:hypothetical protein n=1 Tax=Microbacterium sp. Ag1 TaxID=1643443 RepID=UPI0006295E38|nr:hypothetical protein [Microbacterium sp. Ag1]KKX99773.1 hypothetical protein AAY78_00065 [Microbacterium sp. Ag1]
MSTDANDRWFELAAQFAVPEIVSETASCGVARGQLRQAMWANADAIVLVDQVDDAGALAHVFPVSVEPGVCDSETLVVDEPESPLPTPLNIWPRQGHWVSFAALDNLLETLGPAALTVIEAAGRTLPSSHQSDPEPGSGAARAISQLFDAVDALELAPRLEEESDSAHRSRLDLDLELVMDVLEINQSRAMDIVMGSEPLSESEAEILAAASNVASADIMQALEPLPADLCRELQEPRWRRGVQRRTNGGDEAAGRLRLGYDIYQLAARQAGSGRDIWRQRLEALMATESD